MTMPSDPHPSAAVTDAAGRHAEPDEQQRRVLAALVAMQRQSWEQGVASHAFIDLGRHDLARAAAYDAVTRQTPDGRLGELEHNVVNSGACGEAVLLAADAAGDAGARARLTEAFDRQVDWLCRRAPRAEDGTLFHIESLPEMWVDSVYMVVPLLVLAEHGHEAARQLEGHRRRLFDASTGLYGWRWNENERRVTHPERWATGNGWVVAGIARALRLSRQRGTGFADSDAGQHAAAHARTVIDACLSHADAGGRLHNILDDPGTFIEGNIGQMLAYAILVGVADGWLPPAYASTGRNLVRVAREHVDDLGFVHQVCGSPHFDRPGTSPEAQAFFLLATAAGRRLQCA